MKSFAPIILISVSLGLFFFHLEPQYHAMVQHMNDRDAYESALSRVDELAEVRERLETRLASFSPSDRERLDILLPAEFDLVRFIHDLSWIAGIQNISISNISRSVEANSPSESLNTAVVSLSFETSHRNFQRFLRDIESSLRIIDVSSVEIRTSTDATNVHQYSITLKTYWIN